MTRWLKQIFISVIYFFLYAPMVILVIYSVNNAKYSLQWHGISWQWYSELFADNGLWIAFFHSIVLGISASFIATTLGVLACVHWFLFYSRYRRCWYALILLLIIIPDLVVGVAQLLFFNALDVPLGFNSLLIAHSTFCIPFVILMINSRIKTIDPNIYFSALDLGATRFIALRRVLLPLLWPAVVSAFLLCFTLSFDDVVISYFISGSDFNILPLTIYSLVRAGVTPELNALCTITLLISIIVIGFSYRLSNRAL